MQPPTAPPRDGLTSAQVDWLLRNTSDLNMKVGCELVDISLNVLEDISTDLKIGGKVSRSSYATLHGSCELLISRELDWGRAIVRPYVILSSEGISARFNLGAYYTNKPVTQWGTFPRTHTVEGMDILHGLNQLVGESYAVPAGTGYLAAVEEILLAQGFTQYVIDQQAVGSVLPQPKTWALDDSVKWVNVVNDLLSGIGYQGIWSDWDGRLRCMPYLTPAERAVEWTYLSGEYVSQHAAEGSVSRDYFDAPNKWVALRTNMEDGVPPVEGNGIFTYINQFDGPTSVEARGREIVAPMLHIEAADQASLQSQAFISINADIRLTTTVAIATTPNPLHWHFDRVLLVDPEVGPDIDALATKWTLPLDGEEMTHEWNIIEG